MSRTRRRNWPSYWPYGKWNNLFFRKIVKERKINPLDWDLISQIEEKSLPDKLLFGKVYGDYHNSYKWVKKHEQKKYRRSQKLKLKKDFEEYIEDQLVKFIDFYYGD